ncbi:MAG TPA: carboxypeptidase regulatory-like domain-containing protein [Xanthobacteraceae bacterium]|nr:carboxypeptidase regulatory-like domain-containing protein [Xanthobacteraceae bacterium]
MRKLCALAGCTVLIAMTSAFAARAADVVLSGTVKSAAGEVLGGVTVSAKADGQTITTTVFTDESGQYYFPPLPAATYRVWAQALGFEAARTQVDLAAARQQDLALKPIADVERRIRQLPGDLMLAGLPEESADDLRMKRLVRNNCTGCHTASYILQHRFDAAGWNAIIELMKRVNVYGVVQQDRPPNGILDLHQKELAAYLARARGPGESAFRIKPAPRPSGEAARVMIREYDVPIDPEVRAPYNVVTNDGHDWSLGTPSGVMPGFGVHDSWFDHDGNLWFTSNVPTRHLTIGKIDTKTGAVTPFKVDAANGLAAVTHGMTRDPSGALWFNVNPGRGGLGRVDPKTGQIEVFIPPQSMSPTGGATTVDYDGKGRIWSSAPDGALRFDPESKTFTEFKSVTFKTPNGNGVTYGMAADRDGNGYWAEMIIDTIGVGEGATGKPSEIKLPPVQAELDRVPEELRKTYAGVFAPDFNTPFPWSQGPRRMGTDKNGDVLWIGNSWGGSLGRIDTKTKQLSFVPLPENLQPYHVTVDRNHNAWTNLWMTDRVARYDPAADKWTVFDLPTRGSEVRYISLDERNGTTQVVLPYFRTRKVAVMTLRSEADLNALKAQAGR